MYTSAMVFAISVACSLLAGASLLTASSFAVFSTGFRVAALLGSSAIETGDRVARNAKIIMWPATEPTHPMAGVR